MSHQYDKVLPGDTKPKPRYRSTLLQHGMHQLGYPASVSFQKKTSSTIKFHLKLYKLLRINDQAQDPKQPLDQSDVNSCWLFYKQGPKKTFQLSSCLVAFICLSRNITGRAHLFLNPQTKTVCTHPLPSPSVALQDR